MNIFSAKRHNPLPGFGLTMGFTIFYLSLIVLIPLSTIFIKTSQLSWSEFWQVVSSERVLLAYRLSFTASLVAALINMVFGLLVAWVLVRYSFPGKKIIDGLVDLPFALPTAVAGITLSAIYGPNGFLGHFFHEHGIKTAYSEIGIMIALTFIGLPFVVRTVQPILEDLPLDTEEAAACLGAGRWRAFWRIIFPELRPALLTGFVLAFARALGEYGSVVFISSNIPKKTEIVPHLIAIKIEEPNYPAATAIALVMLFFSFLVLLSVNLINWRAQKFMNR